MDSKPTNPKDIVGIKKAGLSCVPMNVVAEMGLGMMDGAGKYGRHNYRAVGVRSSVYFDAMMRHLIAWWEGEDIDPDSGLSHLTKLLTSGAVLRDAQMQGMETDDRPPRSRPFYEELNKLAADVVDRHLNKNPRHYTINDSRVTERASTDEQTNEIDVDVPKIEIPPFIQPDDDLVSLGEFGRWVVFYRRNHRDVKYYYPGGGVWYGPYRREFLDSQVDYGSLVVAECDKRGLELAP